MLRCRTLILILCGWFCSQMYLISLERIRWAEEHEKAMSKLTSKEGPTWSDFDDGVINKQPEEFTTSEGFLFLNGEYLAPPYHIELRDDVIWVNDRQTTVTRPELPSLPEDADPRDPEHRERMQRVLARWPRLPQSVLQLADGNIVVLFDQRVPASFEFYCTGRSFLKSLTDEQLKERFLRDDLRYQVLVRDQPHFRQWLSRYEPTVGLQQRAAGVVKDYEDELALCNLRAQAMYYLSRWNGSLNVSAFFLVLAAAGHLWTSAPLPWRAIQGLHSWSRSHHPLSVSLVFVVVLSAFDLVWTILTSQAGLMQEANPLARCFIHNAAQLTLFKSAVTCGSIGILAVLRHNRPAQIGAWWACLICTLLAARWLVFHSLSV